MDRTPPASRPRAACPDTAHPLPPQPRCLPGRLGTASLPASFADLVFLAVASGSVTRTAPACLRLRITTPVSHQVLLFCVRLFCQLRPAAARLLPILKVLPRATPSSACRKAFC